MSKLSEKIIMAHGGGGILTRRLIEELILPRFRNPQLEPLEDAAIVNLEAGEWALTTDSYVVTPHFFKGGDIGKLAICGTVNDVSMAGASPKYLTVSFILEEGFPLESLEKIVDSMAETAREAGVILATGDTKVVERGAGNGIFINTAGIGKRYPGVRPSLSGAKPGDVIIINGYLGDHGIAILSEREGLKFSTPIASDVAPLNGLISELVSEVKEIHSLHDPTRGGLAAGLNELAKSSGVGVVLNEEDIPIRPEIQGACDLLGLDPLQVANEGKVVIVCPSVYRDQVLACLRKNRYGQESVCIGEVTENHPGQVLLHTTIGGQRLVDVPYGESLPRIC